jgi:integrase
VRRSYVRGESTTPKSRTSPRTIDLGAQVLAALNEPWQASRYSSDDDLVFGHPSLGSPLDPSKLSGDDLRPALRRAKIEKRSGGGTTCGIRRTFSTRRASRKALSRTGTSMRRRCSFPVLPIAPKRLFSEVVRHEVPTGTKNSPGWTRTNNPPVNSRMLCQLSYRGTVLSGPNCSRG